MGDSVVEPLILDLLECLASGDRSYEEVMSPCRPSCPRMSVWEDASDRGLVIAEQVNGRRLIKPSALGLALLDQRRVGQNRPALAKT